MTRQQAACPWDRGQGNHAKGTTRTKASADLRGTAAPLVLPFGEGCPDVPRSLSLLLLGHEPLFEFGPFLRTSRLRVEEGLHIRRCLARQSNTTQTCEETARVLSRTYFTFVLPSPLPADWPIPTCLRSSSFSRCALSSAALAARSSSGDAPTLTSTNFSTCVPRKKKKKKNVI